MNSIWKDVDSKDCKIVKENMKTDVLIIGGGMTGLSILYELKNSGLKVTLVERERCGSGVTSRSTAKMTFLQDNTISNIGKKKAKKYLKSQVEAANRLRNIIQRERIDCDLKEVDSYLFTSQFKNLKKLEQVYSVFEEAGVNIERVEKVPFDEEFIDALKIRGTYVFHPLKYVEHLKNMFHEDVYEHSQVINIDKIDDRYICSVNGHTIEAKKIVFANHYPWFLIPFGLPLKSHIEVSYLGAKKVDKFESYSAISVDKPVKSMRYHVCGKDKYFIYLFDSYPSADVKDIVKNFKRLSEKFDFDYLWSNNDVMTADYMPYIGSLKASDDTMLIATGYNTWGMTNSVLAGHIIADMITGKKNEYTSLFDPKRKINLESALRFPLDMFYNGKAFIKSGKQNENNARVEYTRMDGKNVAIYVDPNGITHIVLNKCPHLGCGITLNEVEQTWDCLCHGSRYDLDGKCIEGPSNSDISFNRDM